MNGIITVISAERYRYVKKDGSVSEGVTLQYFSGDKFTPYVKPKSDGNVKGFHVGDDRLPYEDWKILQSVPGVYEAEFEMVERRTEYGSVNTVAIVDLKFISECGKSAAIGK